MLALIVLIVLRPPTSDANYLLALMVAVLVALGRSVEFRISTAGAAHMGTPALLVGALLLEPSLAAAAVVLGTVVSHVDRRRQLSRFLFNTGQGVVQVLLVVGILNLAGWDYQHPEFESILMLATLFVAGAGAITASVLLVSIAATIETGQPLGSAFLDVLTGGSSRIYLIDLSKICFGLIAAMLITWTPLHILLIIIPLATMSQAIARSMSLSTRLEAALHETEDSLAEAQRLAKLGSWEWDLSGRYMSWSDQLFDITGVDQNGAVVSLADLRGLLRLPDRKKLEHLIGELIESNGKAEFDHEIVRPDGSVRFVHHVIAWAPADNRAGDRLVGTLLDITDRKQLELQLRYQAYHDGLTGLPNREFFIERLSDCLGDKRTVDPQKGVIFLDLDYFKQINDRFGHEAGDAVLIEVARRLEEHASPLDTVARLSGDEFTILVCNRSSRHRTATLADDILRAVQHPVSVGAELIPMTASAGVVYINDQHKTPSDVLREADSALYRAKGAGRNQASLEALAPDASRNSMLSTTA